MLPARGPLLLVWTTPLRGNQRGGPLLLPDWKRSLPERAPSPYWLPVLKEECGRLTLLLTLQQGTNNSKAVGFRPKDLVIKSVLQAKMSVIAP